MRDSGKLVVTGMALVLGVLVALTSVTVSASADDTSGSPPLIELFFDFNTVPDVGTWEFPGMLIEGGIWGGMGWPSTYADGEVVGLIEDLPHRNIRIETWLEISARASAGILFGYKDDENFLAFCVSADESVLIEISSQYSTPRLLETVPRQANTGGLDTASLWVVVNSGYVTCYLDEDPIITYQSDTILGAAGAGLYVRNHENAATQALYYFLRITDADQGSSPVLPENEGRPSLELKGYLRTSEDNGRLRYYMDIRITNVGTGPMLNVSCEGFLSTSCMIERYGPGQEEETIEVIEAGEEARVRIYLYGPLYQSMCAQAFVRYDDSWDSWEEVPFRVLQ